MSTSAGRNNTRPMGGRWLSERQPKRKYSAIGSGDDYPLTKERADQATDRTPCTAPTVATRTQLVVHAACGAYIGPVAAELCTTKRPLEAPLVSVRNNTCPASCSPQPSLLTALAEEHSERKTFSERFGKPLILTSTCCPSCRPVAGVTTIFADGGLDVSAHADADMATARTTAAPDNHRCCRLTDRSFCISLAPPPAGATSCARELPESRR